MGYGHSKKFIGAGLLGLGIGAIAAWFLSPKSGRENRKDFQNWMQRMSDEVEYRAHKIKDISQQKYDELVDTVSDKYRRAKGIKETELNDFAQDLKQRWGRIKDQWKDASLDDYTEV